MNFAKKRQSNLLWLPALIGCSFALIGCSLTVAPKLAKNSQASFDQGGQTSGILGLAGNDGFWVSEHFVDRYNALIALYAGKFAPPLTPSQGVYRTPTNTFIMCYSAMEHFNSMNRWRKQGAPPWAIK